MLRAQFSLHSSSRTRRLGSSSEPVASTEGTIPRQPRAVLPSFSPFLFPLFPFPSFLNHLDSKALSTPYDPVRSNSTFLIFRSFYSLAPFFPLRFFSIHQLINSLWIRVYDPSEPGAALNPPRFSKGPNNICGGSPTLASPKRSLLHCTRCSVTLNDFQPPQSPDSRVNLVEKEKDRGKSLRTLHRRF